MSASNPYNLPGYLLIFVTCSLLSWGHSFASQNNRQLERAYGDADFSRIIAQFANTDPSDLPLENRVLYLECLARKGQGGTFEPQITKLLADFPRSAEAHAVAGIWYFSQGRMIEAKETIDRALILDTSSFKAKLAQMMFLLHHRRFPAAAEAYAGLPKTMQGWPGSRFAYLLGLDIYRAGLDFPKVSQLYQQRSEGLATTDKQRSKELKTNAKFFKSLKNKSVFRTDSASSLSVIPFEADASKALPNTIALIIKDKSFSVLLDTGNTAGWVVHNRELADLLKLERGAHIPTALGTEANMLEGYHIYAKKVDFGEFSLHHLEGLYLPKPHPDFYDANLNPAFIRDRIVTLDFINKQLLLRTQQKFDKDIYSRERTKAERFPWLGHQYVFIPVAVAGQPGLALLETGAADISLQLAFVKTLGLDLQPRSKYLADGRAYSFHEARVTVKVGTYLFYREKAEVWPLHQFSHRLSGLSPHLIIGPQALDAQYALSFDPFSNQIILIRK